MSKHTLALKCDNSWHSAIFSVLICCLLTSISFSQTPTPTPDDDGDPIKVDTRLVQVETIVRDKKGNIVRDLTANDFELVEGGKVRPVEFFTYVSLGGQVRTVESEKITEIVEQPAGVKIEQVKRTFVFIISNPDLKMLRMINTNFASDVTPFSYRIYTVMAAKASGRFLNKFINEKMGTNDLVSIVDTEADLGTLSKFTNDKETLMAASKQMEESVSNGRYPTLNMNIYITGPRNIDFNAGDLIQQNLNTLKMAESAVDQLQKLPGQKFVFLLSRGMLGASSINGADQVVARVKRVVEKANQAKVTFYSLGLRSLGEGTPDTPPPPGVFQSSDMMRQLAEKTGGRGIFNTNDISVGFNKILDENDGYYQLAFSPEDADGTDRAKAYDVKIRLKRPGLTAQHRSSVYRDELVSENADPKESVLKLLRTPFRSDAVKIKLDTAYKLINKKQGNITTVVNIAPELFQPTLLQGGTREVKLKLGIQITEPDNFMARQEVKNFSLKLSEESWQRVLQEGLVYQFETATRKLGAYSIKIAACVNESNQCGNSESMVNAK